MKDDSVYSRNVLMHDCLGVDLVFVYRAVEQDVPRLKRACEGALDERESSACATGNIGNTGPHNSGCTRRAPLVAGSESRGVSAARGRAEGAR